MRLGVEAALVDGVLVRGDVEVVDGLIAAIGLAGRTAAGSPSPGFVDLQVNGFGGVDLLAADADGYRLAGEALLETGVTAYLPTFITAPEDELIAALRALPEAVERRAPHPRRARRGAVPRSESHRHAPARPPARPRRGAAGAHPRGGAGAAWSRSRPSCPAQAS